MNLVLALLGLVVSILIFLGATAAQNAIKAIETKWLEEHSEYKETPGKPNTHGVHLPGLIGGGRPIVHKDGTKAPVLLPLVFAAAWLVLLLYSVFQILVHY